MSVGLRPPRECHARSERIDSARSLAWALGMHVRGKHLVDSFAGLPQRALTTAGTRNNPTANLKRLPRPQSFLVFLERHLPAKSCHPVGSRKSELVSSVILYSAYATPYLTALLRRNSLGVL